MSDDEVWLMGSRGTVLDEIVEIIEMPRYDPRTGNRLAESESVTLDPAVKRPQALPPSVDESCYDEWKPKLGVKCATLLVDRALRLSVDDCALIAVQLLWLDKTEGAAWSLTGIVRAEYGKRPTYSLTTDSSYSCFNVRSQCHLHESSKCTN